MRPKPGEATNVREIEGEKFPLIFSREGNLELVLTAGGLWYPCTPETFGEENILNLSDGISPELREFYNSSRVIDWAALLAVAGDAALKAAVSFIVQSFLRSYVNAGFSIEDVIRAAIRECLRIVQQMMDQEELDRVDAAIASITFHIQGFGSQGVSEPSQLDTPIMRAHEAFLMCQRRLGLIGGFTHSFAFLSTMLLQQYELEKSNERKSRLVTIVDQFDKSMDIFEADIERNTLREFSKVYEIMEAVPDYTPEVNVFFPHQVERDLAVSNQRKVHWEQHPTGKYTYDWRNKRQSTSKNKASAQISLNNHISARFLEVKLPTVLPGRSHSRLIRGRIV